MTVVGVATEGERYGGFRLAGDTVMLLCQSARNVTNMRALPVSDWLRVLQATVGDGDAAMQRAVRIENRVAQRGVLSPSPPRDRLTSNAGAMATWAAQLAVELPWSGPTPASCSSRSRRAGLA